MAGLRLTHDGAAQRNELFRLTGNDVLGRSPQSQIPLSHPFVSSSHARIVAADDGYFLEDLKSVNGTFLNGKMVRRARLSPGDTIKIHHFTLVFLDEDKAPAPALEPSRSSLRLQTATLIATRSSDDLPTASDPSGVPQRHLQVLYNVGRAVLGSFTVESLSEAILDELSKTFSQADGAFILTPDPGRSDFSVVASRKGAAAADLVPSNTILRHACETREAVLSACALDDSRFQNARSIVSTATTSVLCAPAVVDGDLLALIYVATRRPGRAFEKDDLELLVCLAAVFAVALRNVKLRKASQRPLDPVSLVRALFSKPVPRASPAVAPPPRSETPPAPGPAVAGPVLRAPSGFRAKEGARPEPYTNTGLPLEVIHDKTGIEMVFIPAGEFEMGSPHAAKDRFSDECPPHTVRITRPFYLGNYEVTQEEWKRLMGTDPSRFKGDRNPVEKVSWDECRLFLSKAGEALRLPTEAEWEYACRAGRRTTYSFGDDSGELSGYAWYDGNSGGMTHPVGEKSPNPWGLSDMHGNVWEWCADWFGEDYYSRSPRDDPRGPASAEYRVLRGGSWSGEPETCRSANRRGYVPALSSSIVGFRVARSL